MAGRVSFTFMEEFFSCSQRTFDLVDLIEPEDALPRPDRIRGIRRLKQRPRCRVYRIESDRRRFREA